MTPSRPSRRPRLARGVVAAAACLAVLPASAQASSMTISAASELVESTSTSVDVRATLDVPSYVEVKLRAAGAPCAPNAASDPGTPFMDRSAIERDFASAAAASFDTAGDYLVCGWARDTTNPAGPVVAAASALIKVRAPKLNMSISVPSAVAYEDLFTVQTVAVAEVQRNAYVGLIPNLGKGCPDTYGALQKTDRSVAVLPQSGLPVSERVTDKQEISLPRRGKYLACGYFHSGSVAGPAQLKVQEAFVVGKPCVVPKLEGKTVAKAKKLLKKAHCRLGKKKKAKSKKVKRNRIVRTGKKAGTKLAPNTKIGIVVSRG